MTRFGSSISHKSLSVGLSVGLSACAVELPPTNVNLQPGQCVTTNDCIAAGNMVASPEAGAGQAQLKQLAWWLEAAEVNECTATFIPQYNKVNALSNSSGGFNAINSCARYVGWCRGDPDWHSAKGSGPAVLG